MPKERSINPAQAQRKAEKAKAVKKGKAEAAARRTEKLARRNPERLQKQLDDLQAIQSSGGKLTSHEQKALEELERDLKAVRKAREALGDRAPTFGRGDRGSRGSRDGENGVGGVLGKRRRGEGRRMGSSDDDDDGSDAPEDVRSIPMPCDTPPPIPREVLDRWYHARRERNRHRGDAGQGTSANSTPLGEAARRGAHLDGLPARPGSGNGAMAAAAAKIVYESAPALRDLRKEAVSKFVPAAVRAKMEKAKGAGALVEPEEAERLEREGYLGAPPPSSLSSPSRAAQWSPSPPSLEKRQHANPRAVMVEDADADDADYE